MFLFYTARQKWKSKNPPDKEFRKKAFLKWFPGLNFNWKNFISERPVIAAAEWYLIAGAGWYLIAGAGLYIIAGAEWYLIAGAEWYLVARAEWYLIAA